MASKKSGNMLGSWSFLIGVVLAVVFGLLQVNGLSTALVYILVLLGIIIGLLNIGDHEISPFLMAGAILVIVGSLGADVVSRVNVLGRMFEALAILFVPATIIVALKSVFSLARN